MTDEVAVKVSAQTGSFNSAIKNSSNEFKSFTDVLTNNADKISVALKGIVAAKLITEISELEQHFGKLAEEIGRVTAMTGLASGEVQNFTSIVEASGGNAESAVATLTKLEKNMVDAARGGNDAALAFKELGIETTTADGRIRPVQSVLEDLADKFKNSEDGAAKTAYAMQLMGKGGAQLIPVLNQGKEGLSEFNKELEKTQSNMSEGQISKFAKLDDMIDMLGKSWEGFKLAVATYFEPAAEIIVKTFTIIVQGITSAINAVNTFTDKLSHMGYGKYAPKEAKEGKKTKLNAAPTMQSLADEKKMSDALITLEKDTAERGIGIQEEAIKRKYAMGQISFQEFIDQQLTLENKKYDIEKIALERRLAAVKDDAVERLKIKDEMIKLEGKHYEVQEKLQAQSLEHINENYQNMFNGFSSGIKSMTEQLMRGTISWKNAFKTMCGDMVVEFAKMQVENVAKMLWAAAIGKGITIQKAITERFANATSAAGGAYKAMAGVPYIGPALGAAAAAAAFAGVMAFGLPSAAGGWGEVPNDGVAMIHKKEMVLPANLADKVRNMTDTPLTSPPQNNYHFSISAIDGSSVKDMFMKNGGAIMKAINAQSRNLNPHSPLLAR